MAISLVSIAYTPDNVTGTTDHLVGNIFQQIRCNIVVRVEAFIMPSDGTQVIFGDPSYQTPDYIKDEGGRFKDFNVGDTIETEGITGVADATYIISEKVNNSIIRVTTTVPGPVTFTTYYGNDGVLRLVDEPKGISYDFGLPENNEVADFSSKIDGLLQRFELSDPTQIPLTFSDAEPNGKKSWQFSTIGCEIRRVSSDTALRRYEFEIQHIIRITPWFLINQLSSIQVGQAPTYFDLFKALKHSYRIRSYRSSAEPNLYQELIVEGTKGNTGWIDENFNGNPPAFRFKDIVYNNTIEALQADVDTNFTIRVDELTADPVQFAVLNFILLPEEDSDYANIDSYMDENYCYDRVTVSVGGGVANGEKFGTTFQVFTNVSVTTLAGVATITGNVDFGADVIAKINASDFKRYWITVELLSDDQNASTANNVVISTGVNAVSFEIPDGAVESNTSFLPHHVNEIIPGDEFPIVMSEEEIVGNSLILVDVDGFDSLLVDSFTIQIVGKSSTQEAILQEYNIDLTGSPIVDGARFINQQTVTGFNVIDSEIRYNYQVRRETASDVGTQKAYRLIYPFIFRWEYWQKLFLTSLPADLLDTTQFFDGYNHDWNRIGNFSGWNIFYRVVTNINADGKTQQFSTETALEHHTYNENPDWEQESIKIYDLNDVELTAMGMPYIPADQVVKIVAKFTSTVGDIVPGQSVMYGRIYPTEGGSHKDSRTFSSLYNREPISIFDSNGGDGLITLEEVGPDLIGTWYVNGADITQNVTISALIDSPVTPGVPVETFTVTYINQVAIAYVIPVSLTPLDAGFGETFITLTDNFVITEIGFDSNIQSVQINVDGGLYQDAPLGVFNGQILGIKVIFTPGFFTGTVTLN